MYEILVEGVALPRRSGHRDALPGISAPLCPGYEKLSLDAIEIATLSPLRTFSNKRPLRLAVGGSELPELKRQSEAFAAAAQSRGLPVRLTVLPGHHHFSILDEIASPDGALTRQLLDLIAITA